jgi:signal transduction histidine kinase
MTIRCLNPATWPLILRVPLAVAALMVAVGVAVSNVVLARLGAVQRTGLEQTTSVYLDGLSTAVLPSVIRADVWETFDALDRARDRYRGVKARFAAVTLPNGLVLASSDPRLFPSGAPLPAKLLERITTDELALDEAAGLAWVSRELVQEGIPVGRIVAEIDIGDLLALRREVLIALVLLNAALTLTFAAAGYLWIRRMMRPIGLLTAHIERAHDGVVEPLPAQLAHGRDAELHRLIKSFNAMAAALKERAALAQRLAEEEKAALLGKLASGMAHEVNNPLGGLLNLVDTLDRHGQNAEVRHRSLALLRRGLSDIANVVRASLATYKGTARAGPLDRNGLEDLKFLIQHEIARRRLALVWQNGLPGRVAVDGGAVRQIVLNLLLNACAASPAGGNIRFHAAADRDALHLTIEDEGPGLPAEVRCHYENPSAARQPPVGNVGLGVWTVCMLVVRHRGRIEIAPGYRDGTRITVHLPLVQEEALDAVA